MFCHQSQVANKSGFERQFCQLFSFLLSVVKSFATERIRRTKESWNRRHAFRYHCLPQFFCFIASTLRIFFSPKKKHFTPFCLFDEASQISSYIVFYFLSTRTAVSRRVIESSDKLVSLFQDSSSLPSDVTNELPLQKSDKEIYIMRLLFWFSENFFFAKSIQTFETRIVFFSKNSEK